MAVRRMRRRRVVRLTLNGEPLGTLSYVLVDRKNATTVGVRVSIPSRPDIKRRLRRHLDHNPEGCHLTGIGSPPRLRDYGDGIAAALWQLRKENPAFGYDAAALVFPVLVPGRIY